MEKGSGNFLSLGPQLMELEQDLYNFHRSRMRLFSFHAFSYETNFHSLPFSKTLIFIPRPLLPRLFSFSALFNLAYFQFVHSPNMLIFVM
jgi:hypothetical protein